MKIRYSYKEYKDHPEATEISKMRGIGFTFYSIGHSWGGFSCLNITAFHPDVSRVVAISGFVSVKILVSFFFGGVLKPYRKAVMRLEEKSNPIYSKCDSVETLSKTKAKTLLIYSDNDPLCPKAVHYDTLEAGLRDSENVRLLLVSSKGHNPNYTEEAVR